MERLFGKDTIDDIDAICGDLSIPEIIDGISKPLAHNGMSRAVVASPVSTSYATTRLPADFSPKPDATIFSKSTAGTFGNGAVSVPTTTSSTIAPSAFSNLAST
ncbi:hypothetical protein A0H81_07194 [Grifola frondosa]|uniref:Uncharacterized protein n=1 Tax=Grifola frondosa TaxID=5627 RepID=A0A1C7M8Q2_GRIFR|nr:hypothetical protein A0H81_07194 [Grifola frondosa]